MNENYPRLLIVNNQAFTYEHGPGITLSNLFRGWPRDRLATVHDDYVKTTEDVCRHFYLLGDREARWLLPVGGIVRRYRRISRGPPEGSGQAETARTKTVQFMVRRYERLRETLQPRDMLLRYDLGASLKEWIEAFAPDILYTQPSSICHMSLVSQIQDMTGAGLAIHFMDDWPMLFMKPDILRRVRAKKILAGLRQIVNRASLRLAISGKMAEEYEKRYGVEFIAFHNPAEIALSSPETPLKKKANNPAVVVYSGGISSKNQMEAIRTVCGAIDRINSDGMSAEFRIYTPPRWRFLYSGLLQSRHVRFMNYEEDQKKIESVYRESDLLIIPLSFSETAIKYTALSMPTKVSSYMASGTPILVYAPAETALAAYAREKEWAVVVSDPGEDVLRRMLRRALSDDALRFRVATQAREVAMENHKAENVREKFHALLRDVVAEAPSRTARCGRKACGPG